MFRPPRCPYRECPRHLDPHPGFAVAHGFYAPRCRSHLVPRFKCRSCGRTFSRQTFRMDYRDHRPDLNPMLLMLITSGVGLRQSARLLALSNRCTELKFRKLARHLRRLNLTLRAPVSGSLHLQFDEFESYEAERTGCPVSIPFLIERASRFLVWSEAAPIRPHGRMTDQRRARFERWERRFGRRRDLSRRAAVRTLARGAALLERGTPVVLETDLKASYAGMARSAFCDRRLIHLRYSGKLERDSKNPLFPINHAEAMARDLVGRLRRKSWLVSKKRRYLELALQAYAAVRNFVRRRFNWDARTPAQVLGFASRPFRFSELLTWRQDWGSASIHPLSRRSLQVTDLLRPR